MFLASLKIWFENIHFLKKKTKQFSQQSELRCFSLQVPGSREHSVHARGKPLCPEECENLFSFESLEP